MKYKRTGIILFILIFLFAIFNTTTMNTIAIQLTKNRTIKASVLTIDEKPFELGNQTKLSKEGYDIVQGSCTDGTYGYFIMFHKKNNQCRIAKVSMKDLKIVTISDILPIGHGNDITYNSQLNYLVAVHYQKEQMRLSIISPISLRVLAVKDIEIPENLPGATKNQLASITALCGISYESSRNQYVTYVSNSHDFLVLDTNLEPVCYISRSKENHYNYQGIDCTKDYILMAQSPLSSEQKYNILSIYDWKGQYISKITIKNEYEIESIFHINHQYYASIYYSYYKTYTENKKVTVTDKNGNKKKKTMKIENRKLIRKNYIYKLK